MTKSMCMMECSDVLEENGEPRKQQMKEQPTAAQEGAEWQWGKASGDAGGPQEEWRVLNPVIGKPTSCDKLGASITQLQLFESIILNYSLSFALFFDFFPFLTDLKLRNN